MKKLLLFVVLMLMYVTPSFGEEQPQTIADVRYALIGKSEEEAVKVLSKWSPQGKVMSKSKTKSGEIMLYWGRFPFNKGIARPTASIILTISDGKVSEVEPKSGFSIKP